MPTYRYVAKRGPTEVIEGTLEAEDRAGVIQHLTDLGYLPVRILDGTVASGAPAPLDRPGLTGLAPVVAAPSIESQGAVPGTSGARHRQRGMVAGRRISVTQRGLLIRQFASLIRSQVPLLRTLRILEEQAMHPTVRQLLRAVAELVQQGRTLSEALATQPQLFPPLEVSLIRAGEVSGMLDTILDRLADRAEHDQLLRSRVQMALAYPVFVGLVGAATVAFLLTIVMPKLFRLFDGLGAALPWPTRLLVAISQVAVQPWLWGLLLGVAAALSALWRWRARQLRAVVDRLALRLPLVGPLLIQMEFARFARSLGLLLEHGVPILQAMEVAIPVVGNGVIQGQLAQVPAGLKGGGSLVQGLSTLPVATPFLINTVAVGEESGKLAEALTEVATFYEREVDRLLQLCATLLEPAMILAVGGVVGFIVMAILLPIFELGSVIR